MRIVFQQQHIIAEPDVLQSSFLVAHTQLSYVKLLNLSLIPILSVLSMLSPHAPLSLQRR